MPAILRISPAATGKTTILANRVYVLAQNPTTRVRVVVPGYPQVRAWRRRLAEGGGVLGVQVLTFPQLYQQVLDAAKSVYTRLSVPVQFRLVQSILDGMDLSYYALLRDKPGFIHALLNTIAELKAGRIWPEAFVNAVQDLGAEPRLIETAQVYTAYQEHMLMRNWVDRAGMGWLSAEVLEGDTELCKDWPVLFVDGFDDLTPVQVDVLKLLIERIPEVIITLTGDIDHSGRLVHRRFERTRTRLTEAIQDLVIESGLVSSNSDHNPALTHLERAFLSEDVVQYSPSSGIKLVAAPNRESEVRMAMRWLKWQVVYGGTRVGNIALLARSIEPYRHYIQQTADEFGMPIHMAHDVPLSENPCVSALVDLLSLQLDDYPRQRTIDVWFSPYFDWARALSLEPNTYDRVHHTRQLQAVAVWGKVIGGYSQWNMALNELSHIKEDERGSYEGESSPVKIPLGFQAQRLQAHFVHFSEYTRPPEGAHPYRDFVYWLENLIGEYSEEVSDPDLTVKSEHPSLGVLDNITFGPEALRQRDEAALLAFKDVLRGFVWAEEIIMRENVDFSEFLQDLKSAVDGAVYHLPLPADQETILVSDVIQVRGISFDAVAVLGLAEGEFPTTSREDPFLPDGDRAALRDRHQLQLNLSTESYEVGYFYDAFTRASTNLLLTRPRLTDTGAQWQPSPFWLEVQRLVNVNPLNYLSDSIPDVDHLASRTEGVFYSAAQKNHHLVNWVKNKMTSRWTALNHAAHLVKVRIECSDDTLDDYEGNLTAYQAYFSEYFGPSYMWSASRLESYSTCPFMYFMGSVLNLEPREEPEEGYDARQLGNIYHHIFESLYKAADDPTDLDELLLLLPIVGGRILDEAPRKEQFRVTAWWTHSRQEIIENVQQSLETLNQIPGPFNPYAYEQSFGLNNTAPLIVKKGLDSFSLRGYIDRVDKAPDGTIRIIDYKTSGSHDFTASSVRQGKKLQLPLYALAAREALGLGDPTEGFYWHVRDAEPSPFTLAKYGVEAAIKRSVDAAWEVIHAVRAGVFTPKPPRTGCPGYCPAADICWQYQAGYG